MDTNAKVPESKTENTGTEIFNYDTEINTNNE